MIKTNPKTCNTKSSGKEDYFISVGFAENPKKGDFDHQNFPSKIGGVPVWLIAPEDVNLSFFKCNSCSQSLYFLLQLYCPLDENKNSYHRTIYVFFCKDCWKRTNAIKVIRVQLPEESDYYKGEVYCRKEKIEDNETIKKINSNLKFLSPEYIIDSCEELPKASSVYTKFYEKLDEKSLKSEKSMDEEAFEDEEDDNTIDDKSVNDEKIQRLISDYYKEEGVTQISELEDELENEFMAKIQNDIFKSTQHEDIFYNLFSKVVNFDPKQIVRYCREDIFPLWFCKNGMLSMKNSKCKNCGGAMIFEFQIMPHIFNIYKEIMNIDIGTIVIYTCQNSCVNKNILHIEEYNYIQRTGEAIIDFEDIYKKTSINKSSNIENNQEQLAKDLNKLTVRGNSNNEPDEDGWVEVKKKKK